MASPRLARRQIGDSGRVFPVPRTAVGSEEDQHVIFVKSDDQFVPRTAKINLFDNEMIEGVDGLEEGEEVAVN